METKQLLLPLCVCLWFCVRVCVCAGVCVCSVYITVVCATSVKQCFHLQNSISLSVWILFCQGDIALWWSHRTQGRYGIWIILTALWSLCLTAGWVKPSVPSQTWINQRAEDEKWQGEGGLSTLTSLHHGQFCNLWPLTWLKVDKERGIAWPVWLVRNQTGFTHLTILQTSFSSSFRVTGKISKSHNAPGKNRGNSPKGLPIH